MALVLTIKAIPVIGGSVALSEHAKDQQVSLSIQSPYFTAEQILSSNDLRNEYDYEHLCAAHFPSDAVPLAQYAPKFFGESADSMPVMMAQANFLSGGLLIFFAIHHCVMDEIGFFNVMKVWSTCARGDTSLELEDHPEYTLSPEEAETKATEDPSVFYLSRNSEVESAVFFLSDESLERLKTAATSPHESGAVEKTVITSARISEGNGTAAVYPRFAMAIKGRSHLRPPMSSDYCGNVVLIAKTFTSAGTLLPPDSECLAKAALLVRKSLSAVDDAYIRDTIQLVRSVKDLGQLAPRSPTAVEHSRGCSSWPRQPYYSLDWDNLVGGRGEQVRWRNLRTDGLFVIVPRLPPTGILDDSHETGGVEVLLGLKTDCMRRLKMDPMFCQFAEWRCG
ncbi:hypothetical protein OEA41_004733 [Lepraria neglecta]|uniref:Trichothecene 3-O-acetyltransferase n=1 Tax=Lepraria neglecta TaxID=209136 RepID=A0AAD9YYG9_9LECA|nr:hypothetical protein OEA41_004733 [Lepraria neglecta]